MSMNAAIRRRPMISRWRAVLMGLTLICACSAARAGDSCLLSPEQLHAATGRTFSPGEVMKAADGSPLCAYAELANPKRKLTLQISSTNAKQQFDSRVRMLSMGGKSIALAGVGDAAYYNGTAAGVLVADTLIAIGGLRRSSDPQITSDQVVGLLRSAIERAR